MATNKPNDGLTGAAMNTDRELWREKSTLPADPDNYYAPSIHVTKQGGIGIAVGGSVIVKPLREWHALASRTPPVGPGEAVVAFARRVSELSHRTDGALASDGMMCLNAQDVGGLADAYLAALQSNPVVERLREAMQEAKDALSGTMTTAESMVSASKAWAILHHALEAHASVNPIEDKS